MSTTRKRAMAWVDHGPQQQQARTSRRSVLLVEGADWHDQPEPESGSSSDGGDDDDRHLRDGCDCVRPSTPDEVRQMCTEMEEAAAVARELLERQDSLLLLEASDGVTPLSPDLNPPQLAAPWDERFA